MHGPSELILYIYNYSTSNCSGYLKTISFNLDCRSDIDDVAPSDFYENIDDDIDLCCEDYVKNRYNITLDTCHNYHGFSLETSCSEEAHQYMFFIGFFMCCAMVVFTISVCLWINHKKKVKNLDEYKCLIK